MFLAIRPLLICCFPVCVCLFQAEEAQAANILQDIQQQLQAQEEQMHQALCNLVLPRLQRKSSSFNGIRTLSQLRNLTEDALDRLIKQIHRDNAGVGAGLFIPFASQQYIHAVRFWVNRMHILGLPYTTDLVTLPLAEVWNETGKSEGIRLSTPGGIQPSISNCKSHQLSSLHCTFRRSLRRS